MEWADRQCVTVNQNDSARTLNAVGAGTLEFNFSRSSGNRGGTYNAAIFSTEPMTHRGQSRNDSANNFPTSCP